jgi:hypothetical protein
MWEIYLGVHKNRYRNWYMLIENYIFNLTYKVPEDAPQAVHNFFNQAVLCQHYTLCDDDDDNHHDFTESEVERILDNVIEYVVTKDIEEEIEWEDIPL